MGVLLYPVTICMLRLAHRLHRFYLYLTRPLTVGVRLILLDGDRLLLVRHTYQDGWLLPGGGVEKGETLEEAARREAREETGAQLGGLELFGAYTNFFEHKSDHVIVFLSREVTLPGSPRKPSVEIACAQFFPLDDLPGDLLPGHRRRVEELRAGAPGPRHGRW